MAVIGGGDTALRDALYLTKFAPKVYVVHRRDKLRAFKALQDRAFANKQIEFVWDSEVLEVLGENKVEGLKIKNKKANEEKVLPVEGVFVAIGHQPNTDFLKGQVETDQTGYIKLHDGNKTSVPGVYAAGTYMITNFSKRLLLPEPVVWPRWK